MSAVSAQAPHTALMNNFIPNHVEFKRIFVTAPKDILPPFHITAWSPLPHLVITTACSPGFFCKEELVIQKTLRLPLFIRLGSLDYCNRLEGK